MTAAEGRRGARFMIAFAALWAVVEGVFGVRLRQSYDVTQIVWCRYATHLVIVFAIWGWREPARIWRTTRPVFHLGRSLLMLIMPVGFGLALQAGMPVDTVWTIMWTAPAIILGLAYALLGERLSGAAIVAAVGGFLAVGLMLEPVALIPPMGALWAALMAGSFALYVVATRRLRGEALRTNLFYTAVGVFAALSPYVPRVWLMPDAHDVVILIGIGAVGFVALLALDRAVDHAPVSITASFAHLQVVLSAVIIWRRQPYVPPLHLAVGGLAIVGFAVWQWRALGDAKVLTAPSDSARMPA